MEALQRGRSRSHRLVLAAATAVAVTVAVLLLLPIEQRRVSFTVGPNATPGEIGAYVTPPADHPLELRFSEGSVVELEPKTRARVTQTTRRGAVVLVEAGRARVDVAHHPKTDWQVLAGPYTIKVRGTSFDVGFDSSSQILEVVMRSGVVSVNGPGITSPLEIRGAQRFVHTASSHAPSALSSATPEPAAKSAPALATPEPPTPPGSATGERSDAAQPAASVGAVAHASETEPAASWSALVARGEYRQVLALAKERGIEQALASAGPGDLMALGDAARFSGRSDVASRAYQATRARHAGSPQAAQAAFLLGRMAEGGNPATAVSWYDRYVAEAPAGPFVAEALGRRMVALKRNGNVEAARSAARSYLERFPRGPYAGIAREMTTP